MIKITFLIWCLFFNKTSIPRPELTSKPPTKAPKERLPPINNSLISKELAQLGIKPIKQEYNGVKYLFASKNDEKFSFPTKAIIIPKSKLITKT